MMPTLDQMEKKPIVCTNNAPASDANAFARLIAMPSKTAGRLPRLVMRCLLVANVCMSNPICVDSNQESTRQAQVTNVPNNIMLHPVALIAHGGVNNVSIAGNGRFAEAISRLNVNMMLVVKIPHNKLLMFNRLCNSVVSRPTPMPASNAAGIVNTAGAPRLRIFAVRAPPRQKLPSMDKSSNAITREVSHVASVVSPKMSPKMMLLSITIAPQK